MTLKLVSLQLHFWSAGIAGVHGHSWQLLVFLDLNAYLENN